MFIKKGELILLFNYFHVIICTMLLTGIAGTEQNFSLEHIKQQCIEKCPVQVCSSFYLKKNCFFLTTTEKLIKINIQTIRKSFFLFFLICPLKSIYSIILYLHVKICKNRSHKDIIERQEYY